jgi:hypothetical protein
MTDKMHRAFIRWQGRTIEQLGFVNNLLIGLSTGLLAFHAQLAFNSDVPLSPTENTALALSSAFIFASVILGCFVAWNRLSSFRGTTRIVRTRQAGQRGDIEELRERVSRADNRTWRLLSLQILSFAVGALVLFLITVLRILRM